MIFFFYKRLIFISNLTYSNNIDTQDHRLVEKCNTPFNLIHEIKGNVTIKIT